MEPLADGYQHATTRTILKQNRVQEHENYAFVYTILELLQPHLIAQSAYLPRRIPTFKKKNPKEEDSPELQPELPDMDGFELGHYAFVADITFRDSHIKVIKVKDPKHPTSLHKQIDKQIRIYDCLVSHSSCYNLLPHSSLRPFRYTNC